MISSCGWNRVIGTTGGSPECFQNSLLTLPLPSNRTRGIQISFVANIAFKSFLPGALLRATAAKRHSLLPASVRPGTARFLWPLQFDSETTLGFASSPPACTFVQSLGTARSLSAHNCRFSSLSQRQDYAAAKLCPSRDILTVLRQPLRYFGVIVATPATSLQ
jgi:hypothetical protein